MESFAAPGELNVAVNYWFQGHSLATRLYRTPPQMPDTDRRSCWMPECARSRSAFLALVFPRDPQECDARCCFRFQPASLHFLGTLRENVFVNCTLPAAPGQLHPCRNSVLPEDEG